MKRIMSIFIVLMMVAGSMSILVGSAEYTESSTVKSISPIGPSATLSPTRINGNADFVLSGIASGSGTLADPYIIENWTVDGTGAGYGLYIGNTTAYFIIRNCTFSGASGVNNEPYFPDSNIVLYNVTNGMITNVTTTGASNNGIYLTGWSEGNYVIKNTANSNRYGIVLYRANNTAIEENTADSNTVDGIRLDTANRNRILNNTADNNGNFGITFVKYCNNNTVSDNTANSNTNRGINIYESNYNILENNTVSGNSDAGMNLEVSSHNRIRNNHVYGNEDGIRIQNHCTYNIIENNNASANGYKGIYLNYWNENNSIMNNTANDNNAHDGITIYRSNNTVLINNTAVGNGRYGIVVDTTYNTTVYYLNASDSATYGIYVNNAAWSNFSYVMLLNSPYRAVYVSGSSNVSFENTYLASGSMSYGYYLYYSRNIKIKNADIRNASYMAVYAYQSPDVSLVGCDISATLNYPTYGVYVYHSDNFHITGSRISNVRSYGIYQYYSMNTLISNNTLIDIDGVSIYMGYAYYAPTYIMNNTIIGSIVGIYSSIPYISLLNNSMVGCGIYLTSWGHDIIENNTVNGKPVFYADSIDDIVVPGGMGEILLYNCDNFLIEGQDLSNGTVGIQTYLSSYGRISNNTMYNNHLYGLYMYMSNYNNIYGNTIVNSTEYTSTAAGIYLSRSRNNYIDNNNLADSKTGIYIDYSTYSNTFRNNRLTNNGFFVYYGSQSSIDNDVDVSNTVNGKSIYYLVSKADISIAPYVAGQVIIGNSQNISISPQNIHNSTVGIEIIYSRNISLSQVSIRDETTYGSIVSYSSHIELKEISIKNTGQRTTYIYYSDNVTIENSSFSSVASWQYSVFVQRSTDFSVKSSSISNVTYGFYISRSRKGSIEDCEIQATYYGLYIYSDSSESNQISIYNNTIGSYGGGMIQSGIYLWTDNGTRISGNRISSSYQAVYVWSSNAVEIYENDFVNDRYGVYIYRSSSYAPYAPSMIYHNNFIDMWSRAIYMYSPYDDIVNLSYPGGGNYYSDYNGVDYYSGENQDILGPDGIGDTPKPEYNAVDYYPLIFPYGSVPTYLANTVWPMLNHDTKHTGTTDVSGPPLPIEYWNFSTSDVVDSSPAVDANGTVYFGSMNGEFYALDSDGSLKWNYSVGFNISSSPAIAEDGTIYFGAMDGYLYALNPNGTEKWTYSTAGGIRSSPVIGTDGTIYVGNDNGYIYAIKPDGTYRWSYYLGDQIVSSPSIGSDGTIYVSRYSNNTYAFYPNNGTLKWTHTQPGNITAAPTIFNDGNSEMVLICSDTGNVSALAVNGTYVGGMDVDGAVLGAPAVRNNTIYIATDNGTIYSVVPGTGVQWVFHANGPIEGSLALDATGNIYFGTAGATPKIYALDSSGNELWNHTVAYALRSSPAISDGLLFIGGDSGLYCMGDITPPTVDITAPTDGQIIESDSATVVWAGSDAESGIDHYEIMLDTDTPINTGTNTTYTFNGLSDGEHVVTVAAVDRSGNIATDTVSFIIDTYPPVINITYPANNSLLNTADIAVSWEGSDNGSGIDHYEIRIDGGAWIDVGLNTTYIANLADGGHTVDVRAFDVTGKNSTDSTSFSIDTVLPAIQITSPSDGMISTDPVVTVEWRGLDSDSGIIGYFIALDGGTRISVGMNTTWTSELLADGTHTIEVTARDAAGNENSTSISFTVDTVLPSIFIDSPSEDSVQGPTLTVMWHGSDSGSGIAYYSINLDNSGWIEGGMNTSYTFMGLIDGEHSVQVMATDNAGLVNSTIVFFTVDAIAPEATASAPTGNLVPIDTEISVTFSEPVNHRSVHISIISGGEAVGGSITWNNNTLIFTPSASLEYATQYEVRVSGATDSVGNVMENYTWTFTTTNIGTVTGRVLDENGNPIAGATVTADTGESTTTDDNGNFSLDVPMGARILTISKEGYEDTSVNATVVPGETTPLAPVELPESKGLIFGIPMSYLLIGIILLAAIIALALIMKKKGRGKEPAVEESQYMPQEAAPMEEAAGQPSFEDMEAAPAEVETEPLAEESGEVEEEGEDISGLIE